MNRLAAAAAALTMTAALSAPAAAASASEGGDQSLATVLTSDGDQFDHDWYDYDIVTEAVLAVLEAKPESPVGVLTDGETALTAFIPNDRAFQVLVSDLTGTWEHTEEDVFTSLASAVGIDAIESVLQYHVVPGDAITAEQAVEADGAKLNTALPDAQIEVRVYDKQIPLIELRDLDEDDINPFINPMALDINEGNAQIAHGILFVLRPIDL